MHGHLCIEIAIYHDLYFFLLFNSFITVTLLHFLLVLISQLPFLL